MRNTLAELRSNRETANTDAAPVFEYDMRLNGRCTDVVETSWRSRFDPLKSKVIVLIKHLAWKQHAVALAQFKAGSGLDGSWAPWSPEDAKTDMPIAPSTLKNLERRRQVLIGKEERRWHLGEAMRCVDSGAVAGGRAHVVGVGTTERESVCVCV